MGWEVSGPHRPGARDRPEPIGRRPTIMQGEGGGGHPQGRRACGPGRARAASRNAGACGGTVRPQPSGRPPPGGSPARWLPARTPPARLSIGPGLPAPLVCGPRGNGLGGPRPGRPWLGRPWLGRPPARSTIGPGGSARAVADPGGGQDPGGGADRAAGCAEPASVLGAPSVSPGRRLQVHIPWFAPLCRCRVVPRVRPGVAAQAFDQVRARVGVAGDAMGLAGEAGKAAVEGL